MAINPHHTVEDIKGVRCSIIEKAPNMERVRFVVAILERSGYTVHIETKDDNKTTIGVTDLTCNPMHVLYARRLKNADGSVVTPAQWKQKATVSPEYYWHY